MRSHKAVILAAALLVGMSAPASAGSNKEMVELQDQVKQLLLLQQQIAKDLGALQDRVNTLAQQVNENNRKVSATSERLDKTLQGQIAASDTCVDQVTGQAQPLHDSLNEVRAQLAALSKQLTEMGAARQNAPSPTSALSGDASSPSATPRP